MKKHLKKFILYIKATMIFTTFSRHPAQSQFYFPQSAVYCTISSFSVQIKLALFAIHELNINTDPAI
jgi:hypothetical protein